MKLSEHKDLKAAIIELPLKEKDKLLLRLVAKDKVLTEHLHYKLLENESDLENRKEEIKESINQGVTELKKLHAKEALVRVRKMITLVNHFYKVTKDVFGEVELKVYVLNAIPTDFKRNMYGYRDFGYLFDAFYLKTISITLNKFKKLHEDLQFDLTESFNQLLKKVYASKMSSEAEDLGLPTEIK